MLKEIRPAIVLIVALTLITGLVYPLAMTGIAEVIFPVPGARQPDREGRQGRRLGADRAGLRRATSISTAGRRRPTRPTRRIRPRPSTRPTMPSNSMGSNLGPTNKALIDRVKGDVDKLKAENPSLPVPIDLVTTSGSGLDPESRRRPRCSRCRASPRRATCPRIACASWSTSISRAASSACSASRASTCWRSIWRSIRRLPNRPAVLRMA